MDLILKYFVGSITVLLVSMIYKYLKMKYDNIERRKEGWVLHSYSFYEWYEFLLIILLWPIVLLVSILIIVLIAIKSILDIIDRYFI